jgi:hypothetical protein
MKRRRGNDLAAVSSNVNVWRKPLRVVNLDTVAQPIEQVKASTARARRQCRWEWLASFGFERLNQFARSVNVNDNKPATTRLKARP